MGTRIVFTGDVSFSGFFSDAWKEDKLFSDDVQQYLHKADEVVINLECALTAGNIESSRVLNHASDPKSGAFLKRMSMGYWSIANNHIMDCGIVGLKDTLQIAKENECITIGAGANLKEASRPAKIGKDVKVGILSIVKSWKYLIADHQNPGALTWDATDRIRSIIVSLRKSVDWVVLIVHGGDEYADLAFPKIRKRYRSLLKLGADVIIAHHPHVVQQYERIGNKMIFYSLGNFIFDTKNQRDFSHTDAGVLVGITFEKTHFEFDYHPIHINREEHRIETGNKPAVFRELIENDYEAIWPLEAKFFYHIDFKKRKKLSTKMQRYPKPLVWMHEVTLLRNGREREILTGRIKAWWRKWKTTNCPDLISYITEKNLF